MFFSLIKIWTKNTTTLQFLNCWKWFADEVIRLFLLLSIYPCAFWKLSQGILDSRDDLEKGTNQGLLFSLGVSADFSIRKWEFAKLSWALRQHTPGKGTHRSEERGRKMGKKIKMQMLPGSGETGIVSFASLFSEEFAGGCSSAKGEVFRELWREPVSI